MQESIQQSWFFNQSPKEVWAYLTEPALIEQWLMKTDFKPVLGQKFRFTFVAKPGSYYDGVVNCEVLEIKPYTRLSYSWNGTAESNTRQFNSVVEWTLVPKENGTELQINHKGFEILEDVINHGNGWKQCFTKLEQQINPIKV